MGATSQSAIAVIGIDIGKNSFHVVGLDGRGAIVPAAEVVAWSGRNTLCQYVPVPDRHGGLRLCASSQSQAQGGGATTSMTCSPMAAPSAALCVQPPHRSGRHDARLRLS